MNNEQIKQLAKDYCKSEALNNSREDCSYCIQDFIAGHNARQGAVWVKASERKPVGSKDRQCLNIKYKGKPDVLMFLFGKWHWYEFAEKSSLDNLAGLTRDGKGCYYIVHEDSWSAIEWLDETQTTTAYSKEQVEDLLRQQRESIASIHVLNDFLTSEDEILNAPSPLK